LRQSQKPADCQSNNQTASVQTNKECIMRNFSGKAPTFVVWVISLVLFIVALLAQFGVVRLGAPIATWSWIVGFGLLLLACRVKGL
jgi:hypothetical protein